MPQMLSIPLLSMPLNLQIGAGLALEERLRAHVTVQHGARGVTRLKKKCIYHDYNNSLIIIKN